MGKSPFSYILPCANTNSTPSSPGLGLLPTQFGTTWRGFRSTEIVQGEEESNEQPAGMQS